MSWTNNRKYDKIGTTGKTELQQNLSQEKEHLIYEEKDQVTAAEEQKEAVQVKGKKRRAREAQREIRWDRLDNTAHLFPVIAGESMSNVYRISVTLLSWWTVNCCSRHWIWCCQSLMGFLRQGVLVLF